MAGHRRALARWQQSPVATLRSVPGIAYRGEPWADAHPVHAAGDGHAARTGAASAARRARAVALPANVGGMVEPPLPDAIEAEITRLLDEPPAAYWSGIERLCAAHPERAMLIRATARGARELADQVPHPAVERGLDGDGGGLQSGFDGSQPLADFFPDVHDCRRHD